MGGGIKKLQEDVFLWLQQLINCVITFINLLKGLKGL